MKRFILTGAPGCGKTSILCLLEKKGYSVVQEAATDVIAQEQLVGNLVPWKHATFVDQIVLLQKQRQILAVDSQVQFYDRSPICTYALAIYLGFEPSVVLLQEIERMGKEKIYQKNVFFIENLGFCKATEARTISFEESLIFEKIHEETYAKFGYRSIKIPAEASAQRADAILNECEKQI